MKIVIPPTMWFENESGERIILPTGKAFFPPPSGYNYFHTQNPTELVHDIHRFVLQPEVDVCPHPTAWVRPDLGLIDGFKGRKCQKCGGSQTVAVKDYPDGRWPDRWDGAGAMGLGSDRTGWREDLVLALTNNGGYRLGEAILISARACERCMNALAHQYGLGWGYPEDSEDYQKCNTSCDFCKEDPSTGAPLPHPRGAGEKRV